MHPRIKEVFKVSESDGARVNLSDILNGIGQFDNGRFYSWQRLADGLKDRHDPLLYTAWREVLPARPVKTLKNKSWYSDLLSYNGEALVNGEPCRSTGHWNPPDQIEIFEVVEGAIIMLVVVGYPSPEKLFTVTAKKGDMVISPLGCWHTTYAPFGPATVFNIYTGAKSVSSDVKTSEKYKKQLPVPVWLVSDEHKPGLSWSGKDIDRISDGSQLLLSRPDQTLHEAMAAGDDSFLDSLIKLTSELSINARS